MYVYILESEEKPKRYYVGFTQNLKQRLAAHKNKQCLTTSKTQWKLKNALWFTCKEKAQKFERYLKSGSGRVFAQKHF